MGLTFTTYLCVDKQELDVKFQITFKQITTMSGAFLLTECTKPICIWLVGGLLPWFRRWWDLFHYELGLWWIWARELDASMKKSSTKRSSFNQRKTFIRDPHLALLTCSLLSTTLMLSDSWARFSRLARSSLSSSHRSSSKRSMVGCRLMDRPSKAHDAPRSNWGLWNRSSPARQQSVLIIKTQWGFGESFQNTQEIKRTLFN